MRHRVLATAVFLGALVSSACASLEQSSPLAPSGSQTTIQIPSLVGTWTSTTVSTVGSSCTNFQWKVTAQGTSSLTGEFSAECVGGISAWGTVTGSLSGSEIPYQVNATAITPGGIPCPVTLNGTATIEGDAIRIPYAGTTCLGPAHGEEVLRRPAAPAPAPAPTPTPTPTPEPPAPPPPAENPNHIGPGPLTVDRAYQVVMATGREFPQLVAAKGSEAESLAGAEEMLRRMIWHLQHAGFQAARNRNPSGAISKDKLTVFADGAWHGYDVFYDLGHPGAPTQVIWWDLNYADPVADGGIPD